MTQLHATRFCDQTGAQTIKVRAKKKQPTVVYPEGCYRVAPHGTCRVIIGEKPIKNQL